MLDAYIPLASDPAHRGSESAPRPRNPFLAKAGMAVAESHWGEAVAQLAAAVAAEPTNSWLKSDLAAVRLQFAAADGDPLQATLALAAADEAVTAAPALRAARHNLALALEANGLPRQADREWQALLGGAAGAAGGGGAGAASDTAWRRQAALHERSLRLALATEDRGSARGALESALRGGSSKDLGDLADLADLALAAPQASREHLEERLLPAWARAAVRGDQPLAGRLLAAMDALATARRARYGDLMDSETVAALTRAAAQPTGRAAAAAALASYGRALAAIQAGDFGGAEPDLRSASQTLRGLGIPFALVVDGRLAECHYQRSEYRLAEGMLRSLAGEARQRRDRALYARCQWTLGLIAAGADGDLTAALAPLGAALAEYRALGEVGNAARMRSYLTEVYDLLGQPDQAWRMLVPALADATAFEDAPSRFYVLYVASWLAVEQGSPRLAARFQEESLRRARADGRPQVLATALQRQALIDSLLGNPRRSLASLEEASLALRQVGDPRVRRILWGDAQLQRGELLLPSSPARARRCFDGAVTVFRATSYHYRLAHALFARARSEMAMHAAAPAERDLEAAIRESELQRAKVQEIEERIAYLNQTRSLFETMIAFQLDRGRRRVALQYSEAIKARALLDWILLSPVGHAPVPQALTAPAAQRRSKPTVPPGVTVIEYAVLKSRLVTFVLRDGRLDVASAAVDSATLDGLVKSLSGNADGPGPERGAPGLESLYRLLIEPVLPYMRSGDELVLVPDGGLAGVPFAALVDRASGHFLAEEHVTAVAPSFAIYLSNRRRDAGLARRNPRLRALVVEDPEFDAQLFPRLARLPAAAAETSIQRILPGSVPLQGRAATKAAFLLRAPAFQILHFAGHALIDTAYPMLSRLLFASAPAEPSHGVLYAREMLGRPLPNARLVVLASCSTAGGRVSGSEGVESLARVLLTTGVPTVVASLWDVDDGPTSVFMHFFYLHLGAAFDVAKALRAAQLDMLRQPDPALSAPRSWAGFVAIGGGRNP